MISVHSQGKPFSIKVIQVYALTSNAEEAEVEQFCEDLQDLIELIPKTYVLFIIGDWNTKVGSQEIPGVTGKFDLGVQNEAGQRLIVFCQESALVIVSIFFLQHKRRLYTWTSPNGQYWNQIDYILFSQRWRSSTQSAKTRPGVDCDTDHVLLIAKFRLKLKKVGEATRPFKYDLNQIPYDYMVEETNRFKGLDLIRQSAWRTMGEGSWQYTGGRDKDHPQGKEMQECKMVFWRGLTHSCNRREVKDKGEKERYAHLNAEFQRIATRDKKAFLTS